MSQIKVTMNLRLATKDDFIDNYNRYRDGVMYFIRSGVTGEFDPFPYYISEDTDKKELSEYKRCNQLFVPVRLFDDPNVVLEVIETNKTS